MRPPQLAAGAAWPAPEAALGLVTTAKVDWRSKPRQGGHPVPLRQQFSRKAHAERGNEEGVYQPRKG
jgi:hypothetical protein